MTAAHDRDRIDPRYDPVTGSVVATFFRYAVPSVLGMLAVTSAGIIDGIFIGNFVGAKALAAVNLAQPTWAAFTAIVFTLAVGGSVICGRFLGQQDILAASSIFTRTLLASVGAGIITAGADLLFLEDLVRLLGATPEVQPLVTAYMRVVLIFAPVFVAGLTMDYFVRVNGRPVLAASGLVAFAATNIALNTLFIVYLDWGIVGAAWASALAEFAFFFILLSHWFHPRCSLRLTLVRGQWGDLWSAVWNGFSEFINELSVGLVVLFFNWVMISRQGVEGVAAYTIVTYLMMIGLEVSYGISESLQPMISRNLGAGNPRRIRQFMLTAVAAAFSVGLLVSVLLLALPESMISLFLGPQEQATAVIALVFIGYFWPTFLLNGTNITLASYFTALHRPLPSAVIALSRSLVLPCIGLLLLPRFWGDAGVYLAIPLAELFTFILAIVLVLRLKSTPEGSRDTNTDTKL
ncbi:MATE family efflux transporter [Congregibacter litoralis]|uniref:Multidrug export protein MepA n=1 Tax=Congregibacter litoralis KT71 TaxID=314285 RepID=A4A6I6_9GAMM|nr:MATE family efflux transporter [Congregibacter litoralis]EAQ98633.1 Na+-driven multidrug efflux pump [Congregibacter litoralis KT71]